MTNGPRFGQKTAANLIAWRQRLEGRFVYNEKPNASDTARLVAVKPEVTKLAAALRGSFSPP